MDPCSVRDQGSSGNRVRQGTGSVNEPGSSVNLVDPEAMQRPLSTVLHGLLGLAVLGCGAPGGADVAAAGGRQAPRGAVAHDRSEVTAPYPGGGSERPGQSDAMARTRAQFEAARHSGGGHAVSGCPLCADPMTGRLPAEALINGPAEVWN